MARKNNINGHRRQGPNNLDDQPVSPAATRPKALRTLPDSSSAVESQKGARSSFTTAETGRASRSRQPLSPSSSPVEIAETQQETSQARPPFVDVPRLQGNREDWESLHSSQLRSDGGLVGFSSSPYTSQRGPSQSQFKSNGIGSTGSSNQQSPPDRGAVSTSAHSQKTLSTNQQLNRTSHKAKPPRSNKFASSPLSIRRQPRRKTASPGR